MVFTEFVDVTKFTLLEQRVSKLEKRNRKLKRKLNEQQQEIDITFFCGAILILFLAVCGHGIKSNINDLYGRADMANDTQISIRCEIAKHVYAINENYDKWIQLIYTRINGLNDSISSITEDMMRIQTQATQLRTDVNRIDTSRSYMHLQIDDLRDRVVRINGDLSSTTADVQRIQARFTHLTAEISVVDQKLADNMNKTNLQLDVINAARFNISRQLASLRNISAQLPVYSDDVTQDWRDENGLLHRVGAPARIGYGFHEYYRHGQLHRHGGPARIIVRNSEAVSPFKHKTDAHNYRVEKMEWFLNGIRHRSDGPAIVYRTGETCYYEHNQLLRAYYRDGVPSINFDICS